MSQQIRNLMTSLREASAPSRRPVRQATDAEIDAAIALSQEDVSTPSPAYAMPPPTLEDVELDSAIDLPRNAAKQYSRNRSAAAAAASPAIPVPAIDDPDIEEAVRMTGATVPTPALQAQRRAAKWARSMPRASVPSLGEVLDEAMPVSFASTPGNGAEPELSFPATSDAKPSRQVSPKAIEMARQVDAERRAAAGPRTSPLNARSRQGIADKARRDAEHERMLPDSPDSGVLPGEEQITTKDTLAQLTPAERAGLEAKYAASGMAGKPGFETFEDWASENFAELPPDARLKQMRESGTSTPRIQAGRDPDLLPGQNTPLANARIAAGMPLPEGREPNQYTPGQRRTMSRNIHNPDIPMQRFGGTFAYNPSGSTSSRAPNPQAMMQAEQIGNDQGYGSPSHVMALAQAYGIDASQYGDDMDMLAADVQREKQRHDRLSENYTVEANGMGGYRYVPSTGMRQQVDQRKRDSFAGTIKQRYQGMLPPEAEADLFAQIDDLAMQPDGHRQLVAINNRLRQTALANRAQSARNSAQNYNMTQALRSPNQAPGMYVRSLQAAVRSGDPLQIAAVHDTFGNQRAASEYRDLAGMQAAGAAQVAMAEQNRLAQQPPPEPTLAAQHQKELGAALAVGDPAQRYDAVRTLLAKTHPNWDQAQIDAETQNQMAAHAYKQNPNDPLVQAHLVRLRGNKQAFIDFATRYMNMSPADAEKMYASGGSGWSAGQAGQSVGAAIPAAVQAAGNFVGGLWRGVTGAPASK